MAGMDLLAVLHDCYAAAQRCGLWPQALGSLGRACQADALGLHRMTGLRIDPAPLAAAGYDERLGRLADHPLLAALGRGAAAGAVLTDADLDSRVAFRDSAFHAEWMAPQGLARCAVIVLDAGDAGMFLLELMRRDPGQPFGHGTRALLERLAGHIARALHLSHRLGTLPPTSPPPPRRAATAPPPPGPKELAILPALPTDARLRLLYGLTRSELRVAELLASGVALEGVASLLGVSINTARTHLQRTFDKTGTTRQAELISLLLTGPAALGRTGSARAAALSA